jgi:hypothetical protein
MSPPRFDGPTRPCTVCGRVFAVHRYAPSTMRMLGYRVYQALTVVNWCGHGNEFILVPEADGWCAQVPVLGVAR